MSYQKVFVDNPKCSRRFHVIFDDEGEKRPSVELICPHCNATIYEFRNHPDAKIAREENLVSTATLSKNLARKCSFQDKFPPLK